jgi:hypothetical protein
MGEETMNCFIGHTVTKQERDAKPGRNLHVSNSSVNQKIRLDTAEENPLRSTSLPSEILESAHSFFQHKGFEKTAIEDICNRLNINSAQFYNHFESLDEVLEVLWAR